MIRAMTLATALLAASITGASPASDGPDYLYECEAVKGPRGELGKLTNGIGTVTADRKDITWEADQSGAQPKVLLKRIEPKGSWPQRSDFQMSVAWPYTDGHKFREVTITNYEGYNGILMGFEGPNFHAFNFKTGMLVYSTMTNMEGSAGTNLTVWKVLAAKCKRTV